LRSVGAMKTEALAVGGGGAVAHVHVAAADPPGSWATPTWLPAPSRRRCAGGVGAMPVVVAGELRVRAATAAA